MNRFRLRYADWSWREYAAAAACILRGRIVAGPDVGRLSQELNRMYAPSAAHALNFGHSALRIALDTFRELAPGRNEVIVPGYICPSVVDTVREAGLLPQAAEIGSDLNIDVAAVTRLLGANTLAVVVPHMFACPAAVDELEQICRQAGVFMVDDAAQVVGERLQGRLLGTFGDVGIVSFAQSKAVVTGIRGSGGVLVVNNPCLREPLAKRCRNLPATSGRVGALVDFLWNYHWKGFTGNSGYYLSRLGQFFGRTRPVGAPVARISNLDAAIARIQLARLDHIRKEKQRVADAYHRALAMQTSISLPQYAPGRYLSRLMIALPPDTDVAQLRADLRLAGVETRLGYLNAVLPDHPDSPSVAAARRLIGLPYGSSLKNDAVNKICSILTKCLTQQLLRALPTSTSHETHYTAHQR